MLRRTPVLAALASALALAAVACGGDETAAPDVTVDEEELRSAVEDTREAAQDALQGLRGATSRDEAADALRSGAEALNDAANRLDEVEAPEEAQAAKHDLVTAARELANGLEQAAPNVESGDFADLADTASQIQTLDAFERLNRAIEELRERGIEVPTVDMSG